MNIRSIRLSGMSVSGIRNTRSSGSVSGVNRLVFGSSSYWIVTLGMVLIPLGMSVFGLTVTIILSGLSVWLSNNALIRFGSVCVVETVIRSESVRLK